MRKYLDWLLRPIQLIFASCFAFPWLAFVELEQIGNLVSKQNLKNVPCSSSAPSPDAFRRKDLPAFLYMKIRHWLSAVSKAVIKNVNHYSCFKTLTLVEVNRTHMWILDVAIFHCISPDVCDPPIAPFLWNFFREHALVFNYSRNFVKRKMVVSIWAAGASENTAKSSHRGEIPSEPCLLYIWPGMQDGGVVTVAMISRDACKTSIAVIICITQITYKMINNASLINNWRLGFSRF